MTKEEATLAYTAALNSRPSPEKKANVLNALHALQNMVGNKLPLDLHKLASKELGR